MSVWSSKMAAPRRSNDATAAERPHRRRAPAIQILCTPAIILVAALLCFAPHPTASFSPTRHSAPASAQAATDAATGASRMKRRTSELMRRLSVMAATASDDSEAPAEEDDDESEDSNKQLNIAFVTGNAMKAREIELILKEHGATKGPGGPDSPSMVNLRMLNVDLPEIQEINTEAIAKNKAIQGAQLAGGPCVVEDTSLQFTALGGMPGPFIKWFQQTLRSDGLYKILYGYEDKSATAVCTLAFCPYPHADPVVFTGVTHGTIVEPVEGRGFGWDSIFVPDGQDEPFSCMSTEKKCTLSHRGKAVRKWADWLGVNQAELWERQGGRPAVGHKGLDFKPRAAEE